VLVTGATGFVAGHCIRELLAHGYPVRGTVRNRRDPAKTAHLDAMGPGLELVCADLERDDGWAAAVEGCGAVLHVASPFPAALPDDEAALVRPAVEGTRRVLRACARSRGAVRRVVVTSSLAAIVYGHDRAGERVFTEADWSNAERCAPYQKSKTLAERLAWDFVAALPPDERFELTVVNPGFVIGPVLGREVGTSGELVRKLLCRELPACPALGWAMVDVRDVASAHRLALESPRAAGERYIAAGPHVWMQEAARILAAEFGPQGYRVPTRHLPYWILWLIARTDRTVRMSLGYVGHRELVSNDKARRELGWDPRPPRDSLIDMARSLIDRQIVPVPARRAA
jgi:nucleoside-diphosphate-sugar epimerase